MKTKAVTKEEKVPGLKNEVIGNIVTPDLGNYLRKYLTGSDRAIISAQTKVGFHTVDKLIQGSNTLTMSNYRALVAAVEMAIEKVEREAEEATKARKKMKSVLKA